MFRRILENIMVQDIAHVTIQHQLAKEITRLIRYGTPYPGKNSFDYRHFWRDTDPLHIVKILDATNITDTEIIKLLDCAGKVLRNRKLMPDASNEEMFTIYRVGQCVHFELAITAAVDEVCDMNFELADMVARDIEKIPDGFHVSFKWVGQ